MFAPSHITVMNWLIQLVLRTALNEVWVIDVDTYGNCRLFTDILVSDSVFVCSPLVLPRLMWNLTEAQRRYIMCSALTLQQSSGFDCYLTWKQSSLFSLGHVWEMKNLVNILTASINFKLEIFTCPCAPDNDINEHTDSCDIL